MLKYNFSLSKKVFVFICMVLFLVISPVFYIFKTSLTNFGNYAHVVNEQQIMGMSSYYLSRIAVEQAKSYDEVFDKVKKVSSLLGSQLSQIYDDIDALSEIQGKETTDLKLNQDSNIFFGPRHEPVINAYWGESRISDEIKKELNALSHFNPALIKAKELVTESIATHIITASGIGCYYTDDLNAKNACYHLPPPSEFDLRQGEPFTIFTKQKIQTLDTQWTRIYKDDVIDGLMMTASTPIYDLKGEFKGITGIDIPVMNIINDMSRRTIVFQRENEGFLFAFLQTGEGKLIAFPDEFIPLFGLDRHSGLLKNSRDVIDHSLMDSSNDSVQRACSKIINSPEGMIDLMIDDEKYILAVGSLASVNWNLVLVARESDIRASVDKTSKALDKSLDTIWKEFAWLAFLVVAISLISVFFLIRVFVSPLTQFITATQKVSKGDLFSTVHMDRKDEIGLLAQSFNRMVEKLRKSKKIETDYAKDLENRIRLRTIELEKSNNELNRIKEDLEKTVAHRTRQLKKLNEHLIYSEENERKAIASDLHDSVTQTLAMSIFKLKNIQESDMDINKGDLLEVQGYLEQSIREIRSLIYQMSPPILDDFDIEIALGFLIEETNIKHNSEFHYINNIEDPVRLDQAVKITLYRAVNELITNILKHSGSKYGTIEVSHNKEQVMVRVEDQGIGFEVDSLKKITSFGFGLNSLVERMENFGGKCVVDSTPGNGTKIILSAPILLGKESEYGKS